MEWVLILHTIFAVSSTTVVVGSYTEAECHEAAQYYEAQLRSSAHYASSDPEMVLKATALCIPGPNWRRGK